MKNNRRSFLKSVGLSSGAIFFSPELGLVNRRELVENELKAKGLDVYRTTELDVDICVVGGGIAGMCAAIAAARNGSTVVLIHDRSRLGGNASSEIRMHISGSSVLRTVWREIGILEEMVLDDAVMNPQTAYPLWDFVMYDKVISEPNITLLLDTMMYDAESSNDRVTSVRAFSSQTEEIFIVKAKHYADCTGDGTLGAVVGAEYMRGREAKSKWDESLGQEVADNVGMGNSLLFMADKMDKPMPFTPPSWARKYTLKDFEYRGIRSYEYVLIGCQPLEQREHVSPGSGRDEVVAVLDARGDALIFDQAADRIACEPARECIARDESENGHPQGTTGRACVRVRRGWERNRASGRNRRWPRRRPPGRR